MFFSLLLLALAGLIGRQFYDNGTPASIAVVASSERVSAILQRHAKHLGDDVVPYRHHVLRVLSHALHLLGPVTDAERRDLETALAYHDIALWTDKALAYLDPSAERAVKEANVSDAQLVRDVIMWHHKITPFVSSASARHDQIVNAVRVADWADFTWGLISSLPRADTVKLHSELPNSGFHAVLMRFTLQLKGYEIPLGIMKW